ncbi:MAG: VanZ family protein [Muribaculaceae bacterium]|nr:VanZ family protein [Muribaculaceae bacterium]
MASFTSLMRKFPAWIFTGAVTLGILYLTLVPRPLPPMRLPLFPHFDKVAHALMFGLMVLAMLFDYSRKGGTSIYRFAIISVMVSVAFGALIEILQSNMGLGRSGDWYDLLADAGGALIFSAFAPLMGRWFKN